MLRRWGKADHSACSATEGDRARPVRCGSAPNGKGDVLLSVGRIRIVRSAVDRQRRNNHHYASRPTWWQLHGLRSTAHFSLTRRGR